MGLKVLHQRSDKRTAVWPRTKQLFAQGQPQFAIAFPLFFVKGLVAGVLLREAGIDRMVLMDILGASGNDPGFDHQHMGRQLSF